jgi:plastocyanin
MASKIIRRDVLVGAVTSVAALAISGGNVSSAEPKTHDVVIKSFKFDPMHITVKVDDTIRWTNEDLAPHTATATEGGWDTGEIAKGDDRSVVVSEGMDTNYFCAFHPHMKGTIELT